MEINDFFQKLGFDANEQAVFLQIYQFGPKPASTISKLVGLERTHTYKLIQHLVSEGLIAETRKNNVKQFFVPDKSVLKSWIQRKQDEIRKLEDELPAIETTLSELDTKKYSILPKITLYEGYQGISGLQSDILLQIEKHNYLSVKFFASNTATEQSSSSTTIHDIAADFFQKLEKKQIRIDGLLGNGILMMESLGTLVSLDQLHHVPAGQSAINIFIVGTRVYIIIFKELPSGLKIESEELADVFHLFRKSQKKSSTPSL